MTGKKTIWAVFAVALLAAACATDKSYDKSFTYDCGGVPVVFETGIGRGDGVLHVKGETYPLQQTIAASGVRYAARDNPQVVFWTKGSGALLDLADGQMQECRQRMADTPAPYSAQGNEPGWRVTLQDGRMDVVAAYGEKRLTAQAYQEGTMGAVRIVRAQADGTAVSLHIRPGGCVDDMSGAVFEDSVVFVLGDEQFRGCGGHMTAPPEDARVMPNGTE